MILRCDTIGFSTAIVWFYSCPSYFWRNDEEKVSFSILFQTVLCSSVSFEGIKNARPGGGGAVAMDKYRLVEEYTVGDEDNEHNEDKDNENNDDSKMSCEVRITQQGKPRNYISYAMKLFVRLGRWMDGWMNKCYADRL